MSNEKCNEDSEQTAALKLWCSLSNERGPLRVPLTKRIASSVSHVVPTPRHLSISYTLLNEQERALAVVLLHVLNALLAAAIASLVSAKPISGIDPSSSAVAGSVDQTSGERMWV